MRNHAESHGNYVQSISRSERAEIARKVVSWTYPEEAATARLEEGCMIGL